MSPIRAAMILAMLSASLGTGGLALAAGTAPAPRNTTLVDVAGGAVAGQLAGGIGDPVPLFASPSGPVLFVIAPEDLAPPPLDKPHAIPKAKTLTTKRIGQR